MKGKRSKIGRRGKIGLTILIAAMFIGVASAGLLTHYGSIKTTVDVKASVQIRAGSETAWHNWDEPIKDTFEILEDAPGGESFCFKFWVKNWASVEAPIWFESSDYPDNGVTADVYAFPAELTTLKLTSKDPTTWKPTDDMEATLTFNPVSPTFDYDLTATRLEGSTEYALIYYADKDLRFDPSQWGGDNPGKVITIFTTDTNGNYDASSQSVNLGMNLPSLPDWNINPGEEYKGDPDNYIHWQGGAKIWIVPLDDLTTGGVLPVVNWNPGEFLFETDLISYSDCDLKVVPWTMTLWGKLIPSTETVIIPSGEQVPFFVCYAFEVAVFPTVYTITTWVKPVTT